MAVDRYTWPLQIQHGAAVTPKVRVRSVQFGDGYIQKAEDGLNGTQLTYQLEFTGDNRHLHKPRDIYNFLLAHTTSAFIFTPPGLSAGLYTVEVEGIGYTPLSPHVYTVTATLTQAAGIYA